MIDRRQFLKYSGLLGASVAFNESILLDPYAPLGLPSRQSPVRIRGIVRSEGQGLIDVGISDGRSIQRTGTDGTFEIISDSRQEFVHLTVPGGFQIEKNETGTANFYSRITPDANGEVTVEFDLKPVENRSDEHAFIVFADTQTQNAFEMGLLHQQTVPDAVKTVSRLGDKQIFGVGCGDIMFDDLSLYPEYERAVREIGVPFFQVVGNHDLNLDAHTDEASTVTFCERFGPRYYSFDRGFVHYIVLDDVMFHSQGYIGYLDDLQLQWLENDLSFIEPGRPVIVFAHIPGLSTKTMRHGDVNPSITQSITNRERLYKLLEPYQAHLISGHTHENEHVFEGGIHEHVHGTVCGAWWSGPICSDGTPNGYGVYEINGEKVTWRYKSTGYDQDYQMRVYPAGSDPLAPNEIVANIWDADPEWDVRWFEDGIQKGQMSRRLGKDPMSTELHTGPNLPPRRTWVEPSLNNHMFYAPVSPGTKEVRVVAMDRFGRSYATAFEI
ncbi:MAG: calcineurin-like phosphoesterase C-terminal domain-containing protein [Rhodothermales bacterium]